MKAKQAEIELEQKLLRETAELTKVHVCELGMIDIVTNTLIHNTTLDVHMHHLATCVYTHVDLQCLLCG